MRVRVVCGCSCVQMVLVRLYECCFVIYTNASNDIGWANRIDFCVCLCVIYRRNKEHTVNKPEQAVRYVSREEKRSVLFE